MFVGLELAARLDAPVEFAQVVGEIVGGAGHFRLFACGVLVADVGIRTYLYAVRIEDVLAIGFASEFSVKHPGKVRADADAPTFVDVVRTKHGEGQVAVVHVRLDVARKRTFDFARTIGVDGFHVIVLDGGVRAHAFVFEADADLQTKVGAFKLFLRSTFDGDTEIGVVAIDGANTSRQRHW